MKVYKYVLDFDYSGGVVLVAANSKVEAVNAAINSTGEGLTYHHAGKIYVNLDGLDDPDAWEEVPTLTANVEEPQVLISEWYTE